MDVVDSVLRGYNGTVFACTSPTHPPNHPPTHLSIEKLTHPPTHPPTYLPTDGQTGSGKTFTMTGGDTYAERGLIPRALSHVYSAIKERPDRRFKVGGWVDG